MTEQHPATQHSAEPGTVGQQTAVPPTAEQHPAESHSAEPHPAMPTLDSAFARALPEMSLPWQAASFPAPRLLQLNTALAKELNLDAEWLASEQGRSFLLGSELAPGSAPVAQAYAGHQFGAYSPRLGDGRALLLGSLTDALGRTRDVHLKGSGRTKFSRGADGFAAVGPMLREYLVSEAMHALGVPTTRALAVVGTGARVFRDESLDALPGAVLVRTASSHLRVGSFQYASTLEDADVLAHLADHAISLHCPEAAGSDSPVLELLKHVIAAQAALVARWMLLGFVHGVMNTDNMTISGETIDYGPCAFIDAYDPSAVFSSIDWQGRYAYDRQPGIALWNLTRFAESLLPLLAHEAGGAETARAVAVQALEDFDRLYDEGWIAGMAAKLGLDSPGPAIAGTALLGTATADTATAETASADTVPTDTASADTASAGSIALTETVRGIATGLLGDMQEHSLDFTVTFRALASAARGDEAQLRGSYPDGASPGEWFESWLELAPDGNAMDGVNPVYIPRNHVLDEALEAATVGDLAQFEELLDAVTQPYIERAGLERIAAPPPPGLPKQVTYCGT